MASPSEIVVVFLVFLAIGLAMIFIDARARLRFSLRSFLIAMAFAAFTIALVAIYARAVATGN